MSDSPQPAWREELVVDIKGGGADKHEIDADVVGNSLLSVSKLAAKTSYFVYGRDCNVSVKVKGGFRKGSFDYKVVFDFFGGLTPVAPQLVKALFQLLDLRKFLGGKKPKSTEKMGNDISVTNENGETKIFAPVIINMNNSAPISISLNGMYKPLDEGATNMTLRGATTFPSDATAAIEEEFSIVSQEKSLVLTTESGILSQDEQQKTLEVLTPHTDGKATSWRFYDLEDDTEYLANIEDPEFLESVRERRQSFFHGTKITATVRVTKKLVNERKRTERIITNVTVLPDEAA